MARKQRVREVVDPWTKDGEQVLKIPEGQVGFVYCITNKQTGKKYIGKKSFYSYSTKVTHRLNEKTGRMNKIKEIIPKESKWQEYFGSNLEIKDEIKKYGKNNFYREIVRYVSSKKLLTYYEMREQCARDVLESDEYINSNILGKFYRSDFNKQ